MRIERPFFTASILPLSALFMDAHDLQNKVIQRLLSGSATAPEIAEGLATSEVVVLPVLDRLRADDVVEFMW